MGALALPESSSVPPALPRGVDTSFWLPEVTAQTLPRVWLDCLETCQVSAPGWRAPTGSDDPPPAPGLRVGGGCDARAVSPDSLQAVFHSPGSPPRVLVRGLPAPCRVVLAARLSRAPIASGNQTCKLCSIRPCSRFLGSIS